MSRHLERVVTCTITVGLTAAASSAAAETEWYQPQQVDASLKPAAEHADQAKKRDPVVLRGEFAFASYEDVGEKALRVRAEQKWVSVYAGATTMGESTSFELGAEVHTRGIVLKELPDGKISLITPSITYRYITAGDEMPAMFGLMFTLAGVRYCRCASERPLVFDVRGPVYNRLFGSTEEDPILGSMDFDFGGWGASLGVGMGF